MKLYLYLPDESPETIASGSAYLTQVTKMYQAGFLPLDATVWASAADHGMGMWVLSERSTHVRMHDTIEAGWARITRSSVRFGRTLDSTSTDPLASFSLNGVPCATDDSPSSTIIVNHVQPSKHVQFVANSKIVRGASGSLRFDPFTVIDAAHYTAPEHATTDPVQHAHAVMNGVALMSQGTGEETAEFIRANMEAYGIDLPHKDLTLIGREYNNITTVMQRWASVCHSRTQQRITSAAAVSA